MGTSRLQQLHGGIEFELVALEFAAISHSRGPSVGLTSASELISNFQIGNYSLQLAHARPGHCASPKTRHPEWAASAV